MIGSLRIPGPGYTGIAVAVACALALAPGRAEAGCGDHGLNIMGWAGYESPPLPGDHAPPDVPCQGPNCSRAPASPPVPPPSVPAGPSADAKACPAAEGDPRDDRSRPVELPPHPLPVGRADPVFHPPRG